MTQFFKWAEDFNKYFTKEEIYLLNENRNICKIIRKMQIKTSTRYHYTPIKMAGIKKTDHTTNF